MACNTTIIATNVGGNKEILLDHNTRILIKHHSKILTSIESIYSNIALW